MLQFSSSQIALNDQIVYPFAGVNTGSSRTAETVEIPVQTDKKVEEKFPGTLLIPNIIYHVFNLYASYH